MRGECLALDDLAVVLDDACPRDADSGAAALLDNAAASGQMRVGMRFDRRTEVDFPSFYQGDFAARSAFSPERKVEQAAAGGSANVDRGRSIVLELHVDIAVGGRRVAAMVQIADRHRVILALYDLQGSHQRGVEEGAGDLANAPTFAHDMLAVDILRRLLEARRTDTRTYYLIIREDLACLQQSPIDTAGRQHNVGAAVRNASVVGAELRDFTVDLLQIGCGQFRHDEFRGQDRFRALGGRVRFMRGRGLRGVGRDGGRRLGSRRSRADRSGGPRIQIAAPGLRDRLRRGVFVERDPIDFVMHPEPAALGRHQLSAFGGPIDILCDLIGQIDAQFRVVYRGYRSYRQNLSAANPVRDLTERAVVSHFTRGIQSCRDIDPQSEFAGCRIPGLLDTGIGSEVEIERDRLLRLRPALQCGAGLLERFAAQGQAADMHAGSDLVVRHMGHHADGGGAEAGGKQRGNKHDSLYGRTSGRLG